MESQPNFVNILTEIASKKLFDLKENTISNIVNCIRNRTEQRAEEGFFDFQYETEGLPVALTTHYDSIKDCVSNRLVALGFTTPIVRIDTIIQVNPNGYRSQVVGHKLTIICEWYSQITQ